MEETAQAIFISGVEMCGQLREEPHMPAESITAVVSWFLTGMVVVNPLNVVGRPS